MMALLPSLQWRHHRPQAGVVPLIAMGLSLSLMRRHPCCDCNGIDALVTMALLMSMCRHLAVVAIVVIALMTMTLLPLLS